MDGDDVVTLPSKTVILTSFTSDADPLTSGAMVIVLRKENIAWPSWTNWCQAVNAFCCIVSSLVT